MNYNINDGKLHLMIDKETNLAQLLESLCISRKNRYLLINDKKLLLNGEPVKNADITMQRNDRLSFILDEYEPDYAPADTECRVVWEDDLLYIVSKPAGIIVHDEHDSLANQAARYLLNHDIKAPVRYIHRLDKETSGLIMFCKIPLFQPYFDKQLEEKKITRTYLALARGNGKIHQKYTFNENIGADRHENNKYRVSRTGKTAVTRAEILNSKNGVLLFRCRLLTGRTHQIRVHMSFHGFPILNDEVYGVKSDKIKNMGLWAYQLEFVHPFTHKTVRVQDADNPDFMLYL
ncbi:MAG: RluA family pseudouridine synthase [Erysipelotrichaceae bacterium]|nr:RluA family pseudouridine synthase [Erysipelotrichaceae bacterium]